MPDNMIPPAFREALDDVGAADVPALEGPAPPDPPEIEPERDDDGHQHHYFAVPLPVFAIYSDGSRVGNGWAGHLMDAWFSLATFVTIGLALWAAWEWVRVISLGAGFHAGLFGGVLTAALTAHVLYCAVLAIRRPGWVGRVSPAICLAMGAGLLGWVIASWWMS